MKYIHLDTTFTPFDKSIGYESFTFSGGEPHIKILEKLDANDEVMITIRVKSFNDMGMLLLAVDALKRMRVKSIELFIPYFPAARQDRIMNAGEALSVKVYADVINRLELSKVIVLDPHSEVAPALIDRVEVMESHAYVQKITKQLNDYCLISPDAGALKKVYKTAQYLGGVQVVECGKTRDVQTGTLSGFKVHHESLEGKTCLVVDDICDGGGTFLGLAKKLKEHHAGRLILFVTHGIFSKGSEELSKYYDQIICTDSFRNLTDERIQQLKIQ